MENQQITESGVDEEESNQDSGPRYYDNIAFDEESGGVTPLDDEEKPLVSNNWKKSGNNVFNLILDGVLLVIEYLQLFALLQSLSLRWTWPIEWTRNFSFVFIFNLDFWELAKLATENAYVPARDYLVPSAVIPINYRAYIICWYIAIVIGACIFVVLHWRFSRKMKYAASHMLHTVFIIAIQVLAIPIGVQIGKLFWCRPFENTLDVDHSLTCWSGEHIIYVVLALIIVISLYIVYPAWQIWHINRQVITFDPKKHEMYMRLKHCEHLYGLNSSWNEQLFFMFASFRRFWVFQRPVTHLIKLLILSFYAGGFSNRLVQSSCIFGILLLWLIMSLARLPYRVASYNFPHAWSLACLTSCAVIGAMQNIDGIQSVFLLSDYILGELVLINVAWIVGVCLWTVYVVLRANGVLFRHYPLWPTLLTPGRHGITENTQRYIIACADAKKAVKQAGSVPALLSPVHDLSHHIKVLNALACEAEYIRDPFHATLRDVLDDVIQLHNKLSKVSIFTDSLKAYVKVTVSDLLEILPAFAKKLHQRDFDMVLVNPVKRRMLLKMFAVACFLLPGTNVKRKKTWHEAIMDEGFHEFEDDVIALKNIEVTPKTESRPVSVRSFRKSRPGTAEVEESHA